MGPPILGSMLRELCYAGLALKMGMISIQFLFYNVLFVPVAMLRDLQVLLLGWVGRCRSRRGSRRRVQASRLHLPSLSGSGSP